MLVVTSHILQVTSHTLYITHDDHHSTNNSNTITLSQCTSNAKKCFTSYTRVVFSPGHYNLNKDLILQNVENISIIGSHSTFKCVNSAVGIAIIKVKNIVVQNMKINECGKNYYHVVNNAFYLHNYQNSSIFYRSSALNVLHCVQVIITNI